MKTLIIIHPHFTIMGGAGRFILELGKKLSKKFKVIAISQKVNSDYINNYPEISFYSTNGPTTNNFLFWILFPYWQFKTFLLVKKFSQNDSLIFVNVFPSNWIFFPFKFFFSKNKIYWFCPEPSAFVQDKKWINAIDNSLKKNIAKLLNPIFKKIDFYLAQIPDQIFANSFYSQKNIIKTYHRNSTVIYPGVDISIFTPIPFSKKENYILTVSRLTKFKNINILIKAFSKLPKNNFRLKIVGNGEELNNLKKLSQKLKIDHQIDFLTNISDSEIISVFQKAKLFVLCSKNEPFGIVPIEAMSCGTPVIADNSGGPMETVKNNQTGILIDCNVNNLSNTIKYLLDNQNQLEIMSESSSKWIKNSFTWKNSINHLLSYL